MLPISIFQADAQSASTISKILSYLGQVPNSAKDTENIFSKGKNAYNSGHLEAYSSLTNGEVHHAV